MERKLGHGRGRLHLLKVETGLLVMAAADERVPRQAASIAWALDRDALYFPRLAARRVAELACRWLA